MKKLFASASLAALMTCGAASAATIDTDLIFVIDSSGSMDGEYTNLGAGISTFVNQLTADSRIGSVRVGLVDYTSSASVRFDLTDDLTVFDGLTTAGGGGTENALGAVDFAVTTDQLTYRADAVRSVILITDEDADDANSYSNAFGSGGTALGQLLDSEGFLNNIIYDASSTVEEFEQAARPNGALFDIDDFRNDPEAFLVAFGQAKLGEIIIEGGGDPSPVPLPAGLPLLVLGVGVLGFAGRKARG